MIIDRHKLHELTHRPLRRATPTELRREANVFFVGGALDPRQTLETVFDSHCQAPVELMVVTFGGIDTFHQAEELTRLLKKNFHVHLLGRFDYPAPPHLLERAYAAGIDIVDIPLPVFDAGLSRERGLRKEERLAALEDARRIFPAWGVVSTLSVGEEACCSTVSGIDNLLRSGIVPLPEVTPRAQRYPREEIEGVFLHLANAFRKRRVTSKPLQPLLALASPLTPAHHGGLLKVFIGRLQDHRLLATSDLRRSLRVKQAEQSFDSAAL